jgi:hypothetical protein
MSEFLTSYPRTISIIKGLQDFIHKEEIELNQLSLMVKISRVLSQYRQKLKFLSGIYNTFAR